MSTQYPTRDQSKPFGERFEIDNLIKNSSFEGTFTYWEVDNRGNPENCKAGPSSAELANGGNITQTVQAERATPYTLRFRGTGAGWSAGVAHVLEDGVITQTIRAESFGVKRSFVTLENTSTTQVRFTGNDAKQLFVTNISLVKDVPDPDEIIKNGDFDFGEESWETTSGVLIHEGRCELIIRDARAYQPITGLTPGATYRISCTATALPSFSYGSVYLRTSEAHIEVIKVVEGVQDYVHEFQVMDETLTLELEGTKVAYDRVSMKRISVAF